MYVHVSLFNLINCRANEEIDKVRNSTSGEIAKLQAALKKAEIRVTSLEQTVEQKVGWEYNLHGISKKKRLR